MDTHHITIYIYNSCTHFVADCAEVNTKYHGTWNETARGRTCILWSDVYSYIYIDANYEYDFGDPTFDPVESSNYCRTPDPGDTLPWCVLSFKYPDIEEWDYCNVPACERSGELGLRSCELGSRSCEVG
jgi:hypothetical protein